MAIKKGSLKDLSLAVCTAFAGAILLSKAFEKNKEIYKDRLVWVRCQENEMWVQRYATGDFSDNGSILCYLEGKTSSESMDPPTCWDYYSTADPCK